MEIEGNDEVFETKVFITRPNIGPSPFEVSLFTYKTQPWMKNDDLSQWFNYGLNPMTWTKYSIAQIDLLKKTIR